MDSYIFKLCKNVVRENWTKSPLYHKIIDSRRQNEGYLCAKCNNIHPREMIYIEHIVPVALHDTQTVEEYYQAVFNPDNCQVWCYGCKPAKDALDIKLIQSKKFLIKAKQR